MPPYVVSGGNCFSPTVTVNPDCPSQRVTVWEGRRERGGSSQQKRKPRDSMEAMLPKSLGTSESEIQGVIVCQW